MAYKKISPVNLHARRGLLDLAYQKKKTNWELKSSYIMRQNFNDRGSYTLGPREYCFENIKIKSFTFRNSQFNSKI